METARAGDIAAPVLAHAHIGENGNPISKIDAFAAILRSGMAERVDLACMKLCYVDVKTGTDVDRIANHYQSVLAELTTEFPRVTFIHCTVPVVAMPSWPQRFLRTLLGRAHTKIIDDNLARTAYNRKLRDALGVQAALFDIAATEST